MPRTVDGMIHRDAARRPQCRALVAILGQALPAVWMLTGAIVFASAVSAQDGESEKILASPEPPPGWARHPARMHKQAPVQSSRRPSLDELFEVVKKQPGGQEKVEAARSRKPGKQIPGSARPAAPPFPENLENEQAQAPAKPGWSASLDESRFLRQLNPDNNWTTSGAFARFTSTWYPIISPPYVTMGSSEDASTGFELTNPFISITAVIPTDSYYGIRVKCAEGVATMSVWVWNNIEWDLVKTDLQAGRDNSYPVLSNLGEGYHHFSFVVTSGYCRVENITLTSVGASST